MNSTQRHWPTARACAHGAVAAVAFVAVALAACSSGTKEGQVPTESQRNEVATRLDSATQVITDFRQKVPDNIANRAKCLVVVPGMKQGGLIVGGQGGKGFATCFEAGSWSNPAPINIGGGTLGAQVGFQSADTLSLLMSDKAVHALDSGNFKVGVGATASAGPVGTGVAQGGDVSVQSDIVSYATSSGLFAGATMNGSSISADDDATRALYGTTASISDILHRRVKLPEPPAVQRFRAAVGAAYVPSAVSMTKGPR
jgi:lipid-binding SYLF domain-containing protein